jgi:ABC-type dipeptide/oligopeptide/nickel transport system permease component
MSIVAFLLVSFVPGDPITAELRFMGIPANPETVAALRREYDLDAPVAERYARWIGRVCRLDLGKSIASGRPVTGELARALPSTLALALLSLGMIMCISLLAGVAGALSRAPAVDRLLQALTLSVLSVPLYWLALFVTAVGLLRLGIPGLLDSGSVINLSIAALLLALGPGLSTGRILRQRIADERTEDYVRLAVAIGVPGNQILRQDIARVTAPAVLTMWANAFGYLVGGSVVIERIFDRPGLGSLALQAIASRDYPVLQAYLLLAGLLFVGVNTAADLLSVWIDPRLRRGGVHD